MTRFFNRYVEYRRVGLNWKAAARLAWIVTRASAITIGPRGSLPAS
jgi:hypothetical protein